MRGRGGGGMEVDMRAKYSTCVPYYADAQYFKHSLIYEVDVRKIVFPLRCFLR